MAFPAAAEAATVSLPYTHTETVGPDENGDTHMLPLYQFQFVARAGEANYASFTSGHAGTHVLVKDAGAPLEAGVNCEQVPGGVQCTPPPGGYLGGLDVQLGDGADKALVGPTTPGGVVHGGPGADDIRSDGSFVTLDGGPGADFLRGTAVTYIDRTAPVSVSLDDLPNDGENGEGDNVSATSVFGGAGADTLTAPQTSGAGQVLLDGGPGDDALVGGPNKDILVGGTGHNSFDGRDGDDRIVVDTPEPQTVDGGPGHHDQLMFHGRRSVRVSLDPRLGDDTYTHASSIEQVQSGAGSDIVIGSDAGEQIEELGGNDVILAGGGNDLVTTHSGASYIDAGRGRDLIRSDGPGDEVHLRDGERDELRCGGARDRVIERDSTDSVNCSQFGFFRGAARVRASRRGTVAVRLACPPGPRCRGVLRLRWRGHTVGTRAIGRRGGSRQAVRFKLGADAREALRRGRRLTIRASLEVRRYPQPAAGHEAGRRITVLPPARKR